MLVFSVFRNTGMVIPVQGNFPMFGINWLTPWYNVFYVLYLWAITDTSVNVILHANYQKYRDTAVTENTVVNTGYTKNTGNENKSNTGTENSNTAGPIRKTDD